MDEIPEDLQYTTTHEWILSDGSDAIIGVTGHCEALIGPMRSMELPAVDTSTRAGKPVAYLHGLRGTQVVHSPISGTVSAINPRILSEPSLVDRDPYQSGWLFKLRIEAGEDFEHLIDAPSYRDSIAAGGDIDSP